MTPGMASGRGPFIATLLGWGEKSHSHRPLADAASSEKYQDRYLLSNRNPGRENIYIGESSFFGSSTGLATAPQQSTIHNPRTCQLSQLSIAHASQDTHFQHFSHNNAFYVHLNFFFAIFINNSTIVPASSFGKNRLDKNSTFNAKV